MNLATSHKNKYEFGIWSPTDVTKWVQSCSVSKEKFDLTVTIGTDFGLTEYNNIGTFEPKLPSGNCQVKCFFTDRTALIRPVLLLSHKIM